MRPRRVVVIYRYRLFGEAIGRLLRADSRIQPDCLSVASLTPEALQELHPNAILLDHRPAPHVQACLRGVSPTLTFVLDPESNDAEVYVEHEVIPATRDEIMSRILRVPVREKRRR